MKATWKRKFFCGGAEATNGMAPAISGITVPAGVSMARAKANLDISAAVNTVNGTTGG